MSDFNGWKSCRSADYFWRRVTVKGRGEDSRWIMTQENLGFIEVLIRVLSKNIHRLVTQII